MTDISLQPNMRQAFNVGVLIVQDARQSRGYRVKTAYPLNDVPGENRSDR